jgi:hypothetical protein
MLEPLENMQQDEPNFSANSVRIQFIVYLVVLNVIDKLFPELGKFKPIILYYLVLPVDIIFRSIFLYRQWSLLQWHGARTTPGKAVGFGFIPLFCFYGWFVAHTPVLHKIQTIT